MIFTLYIVFFFPLFNCKFALRSPHLTAVHSVLFMSLSESTLCYSTGKLAVSGLNRT